MNLKEGIIILSIILISVISIYYYQNSSITGLAIYENHEKIWYFNDSNNYNFDENINFSDNEIKLKANIEDISLVNESLIQNNITQTIYGGNNKLSLVNNKDDDWLTVNKYKSLDITFNRTLKNNDIIEFYLNGDKNVDIFLCNFSNFCSSLGYGLISYNQIPGYYNITINNLKEDRNSFRIAHTETFRIDYITAYNKEIINYSETNVTYTNAGVIETEDFESGDLYSIGLFNADEELNGQSINYSYSTDQGFNWSYIQNGDNLSLFNTSSIKFKSELNSNGVESPVLRSITLQYITSICEENWECSNWSECVANKSARTCTDINNCGTENNKSLMEMNCEINITENETTTTTTLQTIQSGRGSTGGGGSSTKSSESSVSVATPSENIGIETKNVENKEVENIQNIEKDEAITEENDISGWAIKQGNERTNFISLMIILGIGIYFVYKKIR